MLHPTYPLDFLSCLHQASRMCRKLVQSQYHTIPSLKGDCSYLAWHHHALLAMRNRTRFSFRWNTYEYPWGQLFARRMYLCSWVIYEFTELVLVSGPEQITIAFRRFVFYWSCKAIRKRSCCPRKTHVHASNCTGHIASHEGSLVLCYSEKSMTSWRRMHLPERWIGCLTVPVQFVQVMDSKLYTRQFMHVFSSIMTIVAFVFCLEGRGSRLHESERSGRGFNDSSIPWASCCSCLVARVVKIIVPPGLCARSLMKKAHMSTVQSDV